MLRPTMGAAIRIVVDVAVYRLRRLEMANFAAAIAIMLVLRLPLVDVAVRTAVAAGLNLLAYLNNDYCDVRRDLGSSTRSDDKTRFLHDHLGAALAAQFAMIAALAGVAVVYRLDLLVGIVAGAGICWIYSARLKLRPYVDVLAMIAWGGAMVLVAFPLDRTVGWLLVGQLAVISGVFESIQVIRDRDGDAALGVRTTAVALGIDRTLTLARVLTALAAIYMALVLHAGFGALALAPVVYRLGDGGAERFWHRVRVTFGVAWLGCCAWIYATGSTAGALFEVAVTATMVRP